MNKLSSVDEFDNQQLFIDIAEKSDIVREMAVHGKTYLSRSYLVDTYPTDIQEADFIEAVVSESGGIQTPGMVAMSYMMFPSNLNLVKVITEGCFEPNYTLTTKYNNIREFYDLHERIIVHTKFKYGYRVFTKEYDSVFVTKELEKMNIKFSGDYYDCFLDDYDKPTMLIVFERNYGTPEDYTKLRAHILTL